MARTRRGAFRGGSGTSAVKYGDDGDVGDSGDYGGDSGDGEALGEAGPPAVTSTGAPAPAPPALPAAMPTARPLPPAAATSASRSFRLRPKAVQRSEEERRALVEQEEKKLRDRMAEDARQRRAATRMLNGRGGGRGGGRGRGSRGRGNGFGRGGANGPPGGIITAVPSGPFSQMEKIHAAGRGIRSGGGAAAAGGGGGGFASIGGTPEALRGGGGDSFVTTGRQVEIETRLNTDSFNGHPGGYDGDDDGVDTKDAYGASGSAVAPRTKKLPQLAPMGIKREEHVDREVVVATTAELEAAAGLEAALEAGNSSSDAVEETGATTRTRQQRGTTLAGSPDLQAGRASGVKQEPSDDVVDLGSTALADEQDASTQPPKQRGQLAKDSRDTEQNTVEERLQALLLDFAVDPPTGQGIAGPQGRQAEQTEDAQRTQAGEVPRREGKLFLFQFPPILPPLHASPPVPPTASSRRGGGNSSSSSRRGGSIVKTEATDNADDVVMLDSIAPAQWGGSAIDLTGSDGAAGAAADLAAAGIGEGGFLGTLSIRKSGRAELSWGGGGGGGNGLTYEMMPGTDVQFLTTAVLLEELDQKHKPAESSAISGSAFGMGSVGGKYNLVPVFSDDTEWTVDASELEIEEESQ